MAPWRPGTSAGEERAWARLDECEEYRALCRARLEHLVHVREPLVLISQIQRSGGTLLCQLLDGHPECHVDPYELKIGHPKKYDWPPLDLGRPEQWFELLFHSGSLERLAPTARTRRPDAGRSIFPCLFLPRLQKAIFDRCVAERPPRTERDVLDCYFTSYFNAWLDNQNLYAGGKRYVVGFVPRLAMERSNLERFFAAYPDGKLISLVRDPRAWYVSASRHQPRHYADLEQALALWRRSVEAALDASSRFGPKVLLLTYEQLVLDPEETMRRVADVVGIAASDHLLHPTFNGLPIRANSSDDVSDEGILRTRADAFRTALDEATVERIDHLAGDLYERALERALVPARTP